MFEIDKKKFGGFVSSLRRERGFTQKELAERLFISDKAVSKWETGASIPDTALLIPLAELLGVSVTELLMCQRLEDVSMDAGQVEDIVKTAIVYPEEERRRGHGKWAGAYMLSLLLGAAGLLLSLQREQASGTLMTAVLLGAIFGAYFCFFVKTRLPAYYDENRIGSVHHGAFRMNVPGLSFNNSNWPHIVTVCRVWACLCMAALPALSLLLFLWAPELWPGVERYVLLVLLLAGLFVPVYVVGKKYE